MFLEQQLEYIGHWQLRKLQRRPREQRIFSLYWFEFTILFVWESYDIAEANIRPNARTLSAKRKSINFNSWALFTP